MGGVGGMDYVEMTYFKSIYLQIISVCQSYKFLTILSVYKVTPHGVSLSKLRVWTKPPQFFRRRPQFISRFISAGFYWIYLSPIFYQYLFCWWSKANTQRNQSYQPTSLLLRPFLSKSARYSDHPYPRSITSTSRSVQAVYVPSIPWALHSGKAFIFNNFLPSLFFCCLLPFGFPITTSCFLLFCICWEADS